MKIEVGEYVRTNKGNIGKVIEIRVGASKDFKEYLNIYMLDNKLWTITDYIVKHSKNIIDLIEVGDIIHTKDVLNEDIVHIWSQEYLEAIKEDVNNGIRLVSILTKEQFKNAEYRIPEEK